MHILTDAYPEMLLATAQDRIRKLERTREQWRRRAEYKRLRRLRRRARLRALLPTARHPSRG